MSDLSLESLAKRVEALEKVTATNGLDQSRKEFRKVVGMFRNTSSFNEESRRVSPDRRPAAGRPTP